MPKIYANPRRNWREMGRRKSDKIREVTELPRFARNGEQVYFEGNGYVWLNGEWKPLISLPSE